MALCSELLVAGAEAGEVGTKGGSISKAMDTAMVIDDNTEFAAEMLRNW